MNSTRLQSVRLHRQKHWHCKVFEEALRHPWHICGRLVITFCCSRDTSRKLEHVKRSGLHQRVAVSHFGDARMRLSKSSSTPKKVKLAQESDRPQQLPTTISNANAESEQEDFGVYERVSSPLLARPKPKTQSPDMEVREELLETVLLYDLSAGIDDIKHKRNEMWMPNGPDQRQFFAAGVVAISFGPPDGHIRLLLTQENARKSGWRKRLVSKDVWARVVPHNLPGGKYKMPDTNAKATALRELAEETAGLLTADVVELAEATLFFKGPAKYYVFMCNLDDQDDLPERFARLVADPPADMPPCRTKALTWMPVRDLARWPRSSFLDLLFRQTSIPAWLCTQQRKHDQQLLGSQSESP